jgi:phage shock protein PspC (stress-responsive transcriptional regulator)
MSDTMFYRSSPMMQDRWVSGVCADIATRAAVPVWLPRVAFVIFGLMHWLLAAILYFALSRILHPGLAARARERFTAPPPRPAGNGFAAAQERFRSLDERLANLEAATVRNESELRRAFRDLERH